MGRVRPGTKRRSEEKCSLTLLGIPYRILDVGPLPHILLHRRKPPPSPDLRRPLLDPTPDYPRPGVTL